MDALRRRGLALVIAAIAVTLYAASYAQAPAPVAVPAAIAQELRAAIDTWAASPGHRGVSASVVLADGAQWSGAAGLAGPDEPLRTDHLLLIASITKTMTAAVILQLVDEGILRLDDPVGRWLSPIPNVDAAITVRQLLNHTSGLANYTTSAALSTAIATDRSHVFTAGELLRFIGPRRFPAGTNTEYTNTAFVLLGLIAEQVTGRPIVELYHQRLWDPLGLIEIYLPGLESPPGPVATALSSIGLVAPLTRMADLTIGSSAFGLLSNAPTIARWGQALFTSELLSTNTQLALRELVPAAGNIPGETGAGLGVRSYRYFDRVQFGHSGGATMGSSLMLHDPDTGVTVAVVMNQGPNANHFVLAPRLLEIATQRR